MNEAQIEAMAQANAILNNVGLPLIQDRVVLVTLKNVYGKQVIYPANEAAEMFAAIAGTKTLSPIAIGYAAKLGFSIQQEEAYSLEAITA